MQIKNTPFTSTTFQNIWKKHFAQRKLIKAFKFIYGVSFYKRNFLPVFINVGENLTKGNHYKILDFKDYKNKVFIVYDVIPNIEEPVSTFPESIEILKSIQYPGFIIDLTKFKGFEDYLLNTFSKNTRMKMRKFTKRLDECFDISTKMFFGDINKNEYDALFESFMVLLQKRYSDKQITNNNMQPSEWNFYKEVAFPLILEKKASLFVVYDNKTPIAITYNYHTDDTLIDAITVFDVDYSKFNMGYVNNLKLISWCFDNQIQALDFSKGYFDYKKRMCTLEYNFEYHIIYDNNSLVSKCIGYLYYNFFELKTYLRRKNINVKLHKLTYFIKNKKRSKHTEGFEIIKLDMPPDSKGLTKIDVKNDANYNFLIKHVNDFLYLAVKPYNDISVFKLSSQENTYIISSDSSAQQVKFIK